MAKLDLTEDTAQDFIARVNAIESETQRQWGAMGPEKLLCHLTYVLRASLGEETAEAISSPIPKFLFWLLFFNWFTNWPQGKIEAPESFFPAEKGDLANAKLECIAAIQRFVDRLDSEPTQTGFSPLLGNIQLTKWARVHGVHMDHHFRPFGV